MDPIFFDSPAAFGKWLEKNHAKATEQWVGFHKKATGTPSLTWAESVDEALRFGWIDGLRRSLGEAAYQIRFTPRKPGSVWSSVNTARVAALEKAGRMRPAGLKAFAAKREARSGIYAFEQKTEITLSPAQEKKFRADEKAWTWFQASAPSYRRSAMWWVVSAKREETASKRLEALIADSGAGRKLPQYTWDAKGGGKRKTGS